MNTRAAVAMLLAYLVPGAGHFFLRRRALAAAFFVIITLLFAVGLGIGGDLYSIGRSRGDLLKLLATAGSMGSGVLYFGALPLGAFGDPRNGTFEYGATFTLTAGLMNLLLVLDCFDLATGRKSSGS
jgi:hypothetical protein